MKGCDLDLGPMRALYERGEKPDYALIDAFNRSDKRLIYLAQFIREEFLEEESPDPHAASQFVVWWETHGADTSDLLGVFEIDKQNYYIRHPKRVLNWLAQTLEEGTWGIKEVGRTSDARLYSVALTDADKRAFVARWA